MPGCVVPGVVVELVVDDPVLGGEVPGWVLPELVPGLLLDDVPGVVFGRVPELDVPDEVVLGMLRCSVVGPVCDVVGMVPVVVADVVDDVDGGVPDVGPCTQLHALLMRFVSLPQPYR